MNEVSKREDTWCMVMEWKFKIKELVIFQNRIKTWGISLKSCNQSWKVKKIKLNTQTKHSESVDIVRIVKSKQRKMHNGKNKNKNIRCLVDFLSVIIEARMKQYIYEGK